MFGRKTPARRPDDELASLEDKRKRDLIQIAIIIGLSSRGILINEVIFISSCI